MYLIAHQSIYKLQHLVLTLFGFQFRIYTYKKYTRLYYFHCTNNFVTSSTLFYFILFHMFIRTRTKMRTQTDIALSCTLSKHCSIIFISTWYMKREFFKAFNFFFRLFLTTVAAKLNSNLFHFYHQVTVFLLSFVVFSGFSVCMLANVGMSTGEENKRIKKNKERERERVNTGCTHVCQIQTIHVS